MSKNEILEEIKNNIYDVLPELEGTEIKESDSLKELGANSIDRADIIMSTLESIDAKVPMVRFGSAKNIGEIADIIISELN